MMLSPAPAATVLSARPWQTRNTAMTQPTEEPPVPHPYFTEAELRGRRVAMIVIAVMTGLGLGAMQGYEARGALGRWWGGGLPGLVLGGLPGLALGAGVGWALWIATDFRGKRDRLRQWIANAVGSAGMLALLGSDPAWWTLRAMGSFAVFVVIGVVAGVLQARLRQRRMPSAPAPAGPAAEQADGRGPG